MAPEAERKSAEEFERTRIKDRLRKAGMSEVESDEVAALFIEMLYRERQEWERRAGLATKQDLGGAVNELKRALRDAEGRLDQKVDQAGRDSASAKAEAERARNEIRELSSEAERRIIDSLVSRQDLEQVVKRLEAEIKAGIATSSKDLSERVAEVAREISDRVSANSMELSDRVGEVAREVSDRVSANSRELSERVSEGQSSMLRWVVALVLGVGFTVIAAIMEMVGG